MVGATMPPCKHRCRDKALCAHACCKRPALDLPPKLRPLPAGLTDIKDQVYFTIHQGMMSQYQAGDRYAAFGIAESLLLDSDIPLLLEVRCHMVLSTNDDHPDYIGHARRAVRQLKEDVADMVEDSAFPKVQLEEAERLLELAEAQNEADIAAQQDEEEEEEEEEADGQDEGDEEDNGEEEQGEKKNEAKPVGPDIQRKATSRRVESTGATAMDTT